jgi:DNA polymerase I
VKRRNILPRNRSSAAAGPLSNDIGETMAKKKKLFLIDGANHLFRAYYALPRFSNSKGQPTGALYGFAQMLRKLIASHEPDYMVVCLDMKAPTFRHELYDGYKANRDEPPEDLVEQFPFVNPVIEALGIPLIGMEGFEADDVIGTLAKHFISADLDVVIVSGDKDLMQLIEPGITILDEMKKKVISEAGVVEKFGVSPDKVVEVMGLAGDSSDNIPGVPGIGIKTATKLIERFGTIEDAIAHASEVKGAVGRKLADNVELARLSRKLVEIDISVPLKLTLKEMQINSDYSESAQKLFKELEFTRFLEVRESSAALSFEKYRLITQESDLRKLANTIKNKKILSIDLETTSLDPVSAEIVGFSLAWSRGEAAYVPVAHRESGAGSPGENCDLFQSDDLLPGQIPYEVVAEIIGGLLADPNIRKIGQNLNYDFTILRRLGFEIRGEIFDTMLASYILDPSGEHGLDALSEKFLDHKTIKYSDVVGKGKSKLRFDEVALDVARDYACEDSDVAFQLEPILSEGLEELQQNDLMFGMEMPLMDVLIEMQLAGMKIDADRLMEIGKEFGARLSELEGRIHELAGETFNVNSPKQLGEILFGKLGLPGGKKTKTGFSTNQAVLESLSRDHEMPKLVLDYRSLAKLKNTYADALVEMINPTTGRVHTSFNQARTATGRLSSSGPNLQNIPARSEEGRRIREAFICEDGFALMSADYSQIELRVLAHMSGDKTLIEAFRDGLDIHAITASEIFDVSVEDVEDWQRRVGKTVNFATIYGQSSFGLSKQLDIAIDEAASYIDAYFRRYPGVEKYRDEILGKARENGFVETLFGRRRLVTDITSTNKQLVQFAERASFNTVIQGTAADIIKRAMIEIQGKLAGVSKGSRMILQVHDELLFEVPEADVEAVTNFVKEEMEGAVELDVPLLVDIGMAKNWADAH